MTRTVRTRDPLLPIDFIVTGLLGLILVMVLFFVGLAIFGPGSIPGTGEDSLCLATRAGRSVYGPEQYAAHPLVEGLANGATAEPDSALICAAATTRTHVYSAAADVPSAVFFVGALVVVLVLVKVARRRGVFAMLVVSMVRTLGWYLLAGTLAVTAIETAAKAALFRQLVPGHADIDVAEFIHIDIPVLITGFGIITVARVLRIASEMRRELDVTV